MVIDEVYLVAQLKALLAIDSPTGYTDQVVRHCSRELERLGLTPELTRRVAIRAVRQGSRRKGARAIVAHLDTLGAGQAGEEQRALGTGAHGLSNVEARLLALDGTLVLEDAEPGLAVRASFPLYEGERR